MKIQSTSVVRSIISEQRGLDKLVQNNQEFIPAKYSLGELKSFTAMIDRLRSKVSPLLEQGDADKSLLQELQNLALICV
jgi:nucleoporin NUP159